jgi:hypothetical protein
MVPEEQKGPMDGIILFFARVFEIARVKIDDERYLSC